MQIKYLNQCPGRTYSDYALDNGVLSISGKEYNLCSLAAPSEQIIDIMEDNRFVANVLIPPIQYHDIDTGESDEGGNPVLTRQELPFDVERVRLILWPE